MGEFWEGPRPLAGLSARDVVLFAPYAGIAFIGLFVVLQPTRFMSVTREFTYLTIGVFSVLAALLFLPWWWSIVLQKRELALGYTTTAVHPEVPRIDPKTRLIIRQVGEPEPTAEQWRQIKARIRELKAEQCASRK